MKSLALLLFILVFNVAKAQDSIAVKEYSSTLVIGELIDLGNKSLKFKQLISDSRCPEDVTCIWAGEAKILVELFENGNSCGEEVIRIPGGGESSVSVNNKFLGELYSLSGLSLRPYPNTADKIKPSDYTLTLAVEQWENP